MSALAPLEKNLNDIFVKKVPALPENGKEILVKYLPWINLIFGLVTLLAVRALWSWAHYTNNLVNYANSISAAYGGPTISVHRLSATVWVSLVVLLIEAVLFIAAFPGTRDRKKSGWDLMFYASIVNIAYGLVILFSDYGGFGSFVGSLIGSAIGLYLLFQIRSKYSTTGQPVAKKSPTPPATTA